MLLVGLLDELQSGAPMLAAAEVRGDLELSATVVAGALLAAPMLGGVGLESLVLAASDRMDRRRVVAAALVAMALGQLAVAFAPNAVLLALALAAWGTACGIATGAAEAMLVAQVRDTDRILGRWGLFGAIGDVLAPALFAGLAAVGWGWRAGLIVGAAVGVIDAFAILRGPATPPPADDDDEAPPMRLREALTSPPLLAWLFVAACCSLFDETFVVFGTLYLRDGGVGPVVQGVAFGAFAVGAAVGSWALDRGLTRWSSSAILVAAAALTAALFPIWLAAGSPAAIVAVSGLLGVAVAPMWSLATARAYRSGAPPGLVAALQNAFLPVEIAAPIALGAVADHVGVGAALLLLLTQPLVVAAVALADRR